MFHSFCAMNPFRDWGYNSEYNDKLLRGLPMPHHIEFRLAVIVDCSKYYTKRSYIMWLSTVLLNVKEVCTYYFKVSHPGRVLV
jgi:hypothetical protein